MYINVWKNDYKHGTDYKHDAGAKKLTRRLKPRDRQGLIPRDALAVMVDKKEGFPEALMVALLRCMWVWLYNKGNELALIRKKCLSD